MKKIIFMAFAIVTLGCMGGCKSKESLAVSEGDNSRNSLDWAGVYTGILSGPDWSANQTRIVLNQAGTYSLSCESQDKREIVYSQEGSFQWDRTGGMIQLTNIGPKKETLTFRVGENALIQWDKIGGSPIENHRLMKIHSELVVEKYWKLVELNGNPVTIPEGAKEPHLILKVEDNRVVGHLGCNSFTGSYKLYAGDRIKFAQTASTMMMCMESMEIEDQFRKVLESADNYSVNGDNLVLNRARMAPLARFVAVQK